LGENGSVSAFLAEMSAVEVSPDRISRLTDAVMAEDTASHTRPLDPIRCSPRHKKF
jgi:transposase-like protein